MIVGVNERAHGRAQMLQQIQERLGEAGRGFGSAIVVTGPRRSGRSHLLDDVVRAHAGPTVLIGGMDDPTASSSAIFRPLFTRLGIDIRAELSGAAEHVKYSVDDAGTTVGDVVLDALERFELEAHPLLIAVDDADLLPEQCIAVLGYVARRLTKLRVFLLLASGSRVPSRIDALPQLPMYILTLAEARTLVEAVTGQRTSLPALVSLQRTARGNPAAVRELCEHLTVEQARGRSSLQSFPETSCQRTAFWRDTAERLTAAQRTVLTVLSIARAVDHARLATAVRREVGANGDVAADIAALEALGYIEPSRSTVRLSSNLDGAAIYSAASPVLRVRCHRLIATNGLLHARPFHSVINESVVSCGGDNLDGLVTSIEGLASQGEPELALEALRWAIDRSMDAPTVSRLAARGLRIAAEHAYFTDAERFGRDIDFHAISPAEVVSAMGIEIQLCYLQDKPFDVEKIDRTLAMLDARCGAAAATLAAKAAYFLACRYETAAARRLLAATGTTAGGATQNLFATLAQALIALADDAPERAIRLLQKVDASPSEHFTEALASAHLLLQLGRHDESGRRLEHLGGFARTPLDRVVLLTFRVDQELFAGRIDVAQSFWEEVDAIVPAEHCLASMRMSQRVHLLGLSGRFDDAAQLAKRIRQRSVAVPHPGGEARLFWALGQIALMRGDSASALVHLEQSLDVVGTLTGYWQSQRQVDLIEALTVTGDVGGAGSALQEFESRLPARNTPSLRRASARARIFLEKAPERARTALAQAAGPRSCPAPALERGRAHAGYARRFADLADTAVSSRHRRIASALFSRIGALGWVGEEEAPSTPATGILRTGARGDGLTDDEQQLVELVLEGKCNGDIARETRLTEASGSRSSNSVSGLYRDAIRVIDEEFVDPELGATLLARRLGISVRTLHRAFEQHGTSVLQEIRRRRIERAEDLLRDQKHARATLSEIAAMSGAPSVAYVRLGLKEKHGLSPSHFRRMHARHSTAS